MAEIAVTCAVLVLLGWIAWRDFQTLLIRNRAILALTLLYVLLLALRGGAGWSGDLAAGLLLFLVGLAAWLARMMGAGDAKLYLPLGLLMGFDGLLSFAVLFVILTFAIALLLPVARRSTTQTPPWPRLREIEAAGKVPYAVPMILASVPAIVMRTLA